LARQIDGEGPHRRSIFAHEAPPRFMDVAHRPRHSLTFVPRRVRPSRPSGARA
jgi:hypothetical protein